MLCTTINAITPATLSLHQAGLAVDISVRNLTDQQLQGVVHTAKSLGISWGGDFRTPDPVHFYVDPGESRRDRVNQFTIQVNGLNGRAP